MAVWGMRIALVFLLSLLSGGVAQAEVRAVLIGVSEYPELEERYQLMGPANDVALMQQVLQKWGVQEENFVILADGIQQAKLPTRENIMQALSAEIDRVNPGDTVILYFSGHGSQEPVDRRTEEGRLEVDGLHELILPRDVSKWDGTTGRVLNAIRDVELRTAIDQITANGAFVWGVFDSCHSATVVRGGARAEMRYRFVSPESLGIPRSPNSGHELGTRRGRAEPSIAEPLSLGRSIKGDSVFFYAAQSTQTTPELLLPRGGKTHKNHGIFTFTLAQVLAREKPMTYRQVAQRVLDLYETDEHISTLRTPAFSGGTALDRLVLGEDTLPMQQFPIDTDALTIATGALAGVGEGAIFAIVSSPAAGDDEVIGYARATDVDLNQSTLVPIAYRDRALWDPSKVVEGHHARVVQNGVSLGLRVAVDASRCGQPCPWMESIHLIQNEGVRNVDLVWVDEGADVTLVALDEQLLATSPLEDWSAGCEIEKDSAPYGYSIVERGATAIASAPDAIASALHGFARNRNLIRLAAHISASSSFDGFSVDLAVETFEGARFSITPEQTPILKTGDKLTLTVKNQSRDPVDVTVLAIHSGFGISVLYPYYEGEMNRLQPRAIAPISWEMNLTGVRLPQVTERIMIIAVPGVEHRKHTDFSFLARPHLSDDQGAGTRSDALHRIFADAAFAHYRTRGDEPNLTEADVNIDVFTILGHGHGHVTPAAAHH